MERAQGTPGHTRTEESEGTVESVFVEVAEDGFVGFPDLLEGAEDDEEEPSVSFRNLARVPLGSGGLVAVASSGCTNRCSGGKTTGESQMDTGGEERVDEATGVPSHADMRAGISTGAIGPVGCILDVGDELAFTKDSQDTGCKLKAIEVEVLAGWRTHVALSLGCHGLIADNTDRGSAIV